MELLCHVNPVSVSVTSQMDEVGRRGHGAAERLVKAYAVGAG